MVIVQRLKPGISWVVQKNGVKGDGAGLVTAVNIGGNYFAFRLYVNGKPTKKILTFCDPYKFNEVKRS